MLLPPNSSRRQEARTRRVLANLHGPTIRTTALAATITTALVATITTTVIAVTTTVITRAAGTVTIIRNLKHL